MTKPNGCIITSYKNNGSSKKYQKHQNETKKLHDNTNNSSNHNNNDKSNNLDKNSNKNSYEKSNMITTIKMT